MKKDLIIIGASGLLGSMLRICALENDKWNIHSVSLRGVSPDLLSISRALGEWPADTIIINAAAVKWRPGGHNSLVDLDFVNSRLPHMLATICIQNDWWLVQTSTDGIFSGKKGSYSENDEADATDLYGISKIRGEPFERALVLRQSFFGPELSDHKSLMGWLAKNKGGKVIGYRNHVWQGLTSLALSRALLQIIEQQDSMAGLFHIFSPEPISKGILLREIATCFSWDIEVEIIDAVGKVDRSMRSEHCLISDLAIPSFKEQLIELHKFVTLHASYYPKYLPILA